MITETTVKTILRKQKRLDSWFISHYGLNIYRGCHHNCVYCDGRDEMYRVKGDFGKDVEVKTNIIEILDRELNPARKRKPMPKSFILLGGGVTDAYQPVEKKYQFARKTLELLYKYKYPVHILTKSTLVERDIDLLQKINKQNRVIVSFSFSSANDNLSKAFEPGVATPSERLATISKLKRAGISCGMYLMPVIPFVTDSPKMIEQTLRAGKNAGVDFAIFGTLTLKEGQQKDYFMNFIDKYIPDLSTQFDIIYEQNNKWGQANSQYVESANYVFDKIASSLKIPKRIPPRLLINVLNINDLVVVVLEYLDYLLKLKNKQNPYGYAAFKLSQVEQSLRNLTVSQISGINGVGNVTAKIVQEVLKTGTSSYLEKLI